MDTETKLDQILKIVTIVQQDLTQVKQDVAILKKDVLELKERVTTIEERMTNLEDRMANLEERMTNLEERVTKLEPRVTSLERSVFLIETEQGERIKALFDARETNENKHEEIMNLCSSIKSEIQGTLFNHEKRISKLEGNLVPSF